MGEEVDTVAVISQTIRGVVGDDDDLFQEAYAIVCERDRFTLSEVRGISRQVRKKAFSSRLTEQGILRSLDAPLRGDEERNGFTLASVLSAPDLEPADILEEQPQFSRRGRKRPGAETRLDQEVTDELEKRYPGVPYREAIRAVLGIKPLRTGAWFPHEDAAIRRLYPSGGSILVRGEIDRSPGQITHRARKLGIRCVEFRPIAGLLKSAEVAKILRVSTPMIAKLVKAGVITPLRAGTGKRNGYLFFRPEDVERVRHTGW